MKLATIFLFLLPLIGRLAWDYHTIMVQKRFIDARSHFLRWGYTTIGVFLIALLNHLRIDFKPYLLCGVAAQAGIFFLGFDWGLNILRGLKWSYRSPMVDHPSFFERLRQKTWIPIEVLVKIWLAAAGITAYINYELL